MKILQIILSFELFLYLLLSSFEFTNCKGMWHNILKNEKKNKDNNRSISIVILISLLIVFVIIFSLLQKFNIVNKFNFIFFVLTLFSFLNYLLRIYNLLKPLSKYTFDQTSILGVFAYVFSTNGTEDFFQKINFYCARVNNSDLHDFIFIIVIIVFSFLYFLLIVAFIPAIANKFISIFAIALKEKKKIIANLYMKIVSKIIKMISIDSMSFKVDRTNNAGTRALINFVITFFAYLLKILKCSCYLMMSFLLIFILFVLSFFKKCFIMVNSCFIHLSKIDNEINLSFYIRVSIIASMIITMIIISKYNILKNDINYDIYEYVSGTILIPLILDSINKYREILND